MRRVFMYIAGVVMFVCVFALAHSPAHADGTASIVGLYPGAEVPIGATVSFSIISNGFSSPTYYLVDSFAGGATSGNIDSSGNFSWTPNKDNVGTHGLTISVSDAQGDSATVSQQIIVDGAASLSIQSLSPSASVNIGNPVTFSVSPSGLFNPTYTVGDSFLNSSLQNYALNASGQFNWTPIAQDIGIHTIAIHAKDQYGNTVSTSVTITVLPTAAVFFTNLAPGTSVNANSILTFIASSTGFISPTYTLSDSFYSIGTSTMSIDSSSGKASWTPVYNDIGSHTITVTATDSTGRSGKATIGIAVLSPLPASATQTVTPATSTPTPTPTTQAAAPAAPAKSQTTPAQTGASVSTKKIAQTSATPQTSNTTYSPFQTPTLTFTATTSTDRIASTAPTVVPEKSIDIPPNAPTESMVGFFFHSTINFFTSLFKLL